MCSIAEDYFTNLFACRVGAYAPILDKVTSCITLEDNSSLLDPFTQEEFTQAIFQMHSDKAPGPDGLNPGFYQRFWSLCGPCNFNAGCTWLHEGHFLRSLNDSTIVLIPKCDSPKSMKDHLRRISLCNVLYKIVSKVLANRLRTVVSKCVSKEQSAFVEGCSILYNAMIAMEVIHHM